MISEPQLCSIAEVTSLKLPAYTVVSKQALNRQAGQKGGQAIIEKYGGVPVSEPYRKSQWQKWWEKEGYIQVAKSKSKSIIEPAKSVQLAEFMGVMLGDGGISNYHVSVTLHSVDDTEYAQYLLRLMESLFKVTPKVYVKKNAQAVNIVIARKQLVRYLVTLGLRQGNKLHSGLAIPSWILVSQPYRRACLRGLFDTDGSVYKHAYISKSRRYVYTKIGFSSASPSLLKQVAEILIREKITPSCVGNNLTIGSRVDVDRFLHCIGFNNTKHLKRLVR